MSVIEICRLWCFAVSVAVLVTEGVYGNCKNDPYHILLCCVSLTSYIDVYANLFVSENLPVEQGGYEQIPVIIDKESNENEEDEKKVEYEKEDSRIIRDLKNEENEDYEVV